MGVVLRVIASEDEAPACPEIRTLATGCQWNCEVNMLKGLGSRLGFREPACLCKKGYCSGGGRCLNKTVMFCTHFKRPSCGRLDPDWSLLKSVNESSKTPEQMESRRVVCY